jgi:hypothetical protein
MKDFATQELLLEMAVRTIQVPQTNVLNNQHVSTSLLCRDEHEGMKYNLFAAVFRYLHDLPSCSATP